MVTEAKEYASPKQLELLKRYLKEGTLGKKQLTKPLWLTSPQARELGYETPEGEDFLLSPTQPKEGALYGGIPLPITPVLPAFEIPETLSKSLQNLYPESFTGLETPEQTLTAIQTIAFEDPDAFVKNIQTKGRNADTETILRGLGLEEKNINAVFLPETFQKALPLLVREINRDEMTDYLLKDPENLRRNLITAGRNANTEALVKTLYTDITESQLKNYFSQTAMVIEKEAKQAKAGFGAAFTAGTGDLVANVGGIFRWLGAEGIGQKITDVGQFMQVQLKPDELGDFTWKQLFNGDWWINRGVRMLPNLMLLAIPGIGGYGLAGSIAGRVGLGALGKTILTGIGGAALSRPLEGAMEAAGAYDQARAKGLSHEDAEVAANKVFVNNLKLGGLDAAQLAVAFAPQPARVFGQMAKSGLFRTAMVAGKLAFTGLTEGGEELYQEMIQLRAMGDERGFGELIKDPAMQEVFALGAAAGIGMGGGGDIIVRIQNRVIEKLSPEQKTTYEDNVAELVRQGLNDFEAKKQALDNVAETPEGEKIVKEATAQVEKEATVRQIKPKTEADKIALDNLKKKLVDEGKVEAKAVGYVEPELPTVEESQLKELGWSDARIAELDVGERSSIIRNKITPEVAREKPLEIKPVTPEVTKPIDVGNNYSVRDQKNVVTSLKKPEDFKDLQSYGQYMLSQGYKATYTKRTGKTIWEKTSEVKPPTPEVGITYPATQTGAEARAKAEGISIAEASRLNAEEAVIPEKVVIRETLTEPKQYVLTVGIWAAPAWREVFASKKEAELVRKKIKAGTYFEEVAARVKAEAVTPPAEVTPEVKELPAQPPPAGIPPPQPPPTQSIVPPAPLPAMPRDSEIKRIITMAKRQIELNPAGAFTRLMLKIPGIRQALAFNQPALTLNKDVHTAMVAEQQARADVANFSLSSRIRLLRELRDVFGKDVLRGGKSDIKFLGTIEQSRNPITGTLKDIADNPELYELSTAQLGALANMEVHNNTMLDWVVENYGAEIGKFIPKPDGAFLPNIDISEDVIEYLESETRAVVSGRGKTRIWATARERIAGKTPFKPELDVQKLIEGLDSFKASAAAGNTYRAAIGGLTRLEAMEKTHPELYDKMIALRKKLQRLQGYRNVLRQQELESIDTFLSSSFEDADIGNLRDSLELKPGRYVAKAQAGKTFADIDAEINEVRADFEEIRPAWKAANLKPYVFVQEGLFRYFPSDMVKDIKYSREMSRSKALKAIEMVRAGTFTGDFSPFTIQGVIGVLADPINSMVVGVGGLKASIVHKDPFRSVRISALGEDIDANPQEWGIFASLRGYTVAGTAPEYSAGYLSKLPGWSAANESAFVSVTRAQFHSWRANYRNMMKHGITELDAQIMAMKIASEIYPLANPGLLGQSQKRAALLRTLPTSYSFIVQPLALIGETTTGLAKLATFQKLTPKETLSIKVMLTGVVSTLAISATSAALSAIARGDDDEDVINAMWQAIDPDPKNGNFASIIIGNKRIPLGGPYRALFRAFYPQKIEGIPFPVPFAGVPMYLKNRITPLLRTQLDLVLNKDYSKTEIRKGDFPEQMLRMLEYELENILPLTAGAPLEAVRLGERYKEDIWQQVISQFMGVNLVTLDNTYLDRERKKLGLPIPWEYNEAKPFRVQKQDNYSIAGYFGKVGQVYTDLDPETMTERKGYEPLDKLMVEAHILWDDTELLTNQKLKELTLEEAELRYEKGNISQSDFVLITNYYNQKDDRSKAQFVKDNPGLNVNPRNDYLLKNTKENALLALVGKVKLLTKESYNEFNRLVGEYDIPDNALPELTLPPKDSIDGYFKYQDMENKNSWEAQLLLAKDEKLLQFLGRQPIDTPIASLELKTEKTYRAIWHKLDDKDYLKTLDDKVKDENSLTARDRYIADLKATKIGDQTYIDIDRRIEAIEIGTNKAPTDPKIVESWVDRGRTIDQFTAGSSEAKVWLLDHPDVWKWALDNELLTDDGKDWNKNVLRINVQWREQDKAYEALKTDQTRADYLKANNDYRIARRQRDFYSLNVPDIADNLRDKYVGFYELSEKGYVKERYLANNPDLESILTNPAIMGSSVRDKVDATKIPDVRYDNLYFEYEDLFEELDGYSDGASDLYIADKDEREAKRESLLARNPDFQQAIWERQGYLFFIGNEKLVPDYVGYKVIETRGKPPGQDYWFDDDWYLLDHPELYRAMTDLYTKTEGKEGWKPGARDFSRVPPKDVYEQYLIYDSMIGSPDMSRSKAREQYRRTHPKLDAWLVLIGAVSKPIEQIDVEAGMTTAEKIAIDLAKKRAEIDRLKEEIERKLKAMK